MVRVLCEVQVSETRFGARVQAGSIRWAVSIAEARYPGCGPGRFSDRP